MTKGAEREGEDRRGQKIKDNITKERKVEMRGEIACVFHNVNANEAWMSATIPTSFRSHANTLGKSQSLPVNTRLRQIGKHGEANSAAARPPVSGPFISLSDFYSLQSNS